MFGVLVQVACDWLAGKAVVDVLHDPALRALLKDDRTAGSDSVHPRGRAYASVLMRLNAGWGERITQCASGDQGLAVQRTHEDATLVPHHPLNLIDARGVQGERDAR